MAKPKLFSLDLQEMSQDIMDMGLLQKVQFNLNSTRTLNDPIRVENQRDERRKDAPVLTRDDGINVLDMITEKMPSTDLIIKISD
jgi:hypothetical protein